MLTYTTHLKKLILPEYGRNIQNMVDHCLTIEDRDERTRCACTIVDTMNILFPATRDPEGYRRKLWDHLAIMSDFRLDIDLPFELVRPEEFSATPEPMALPSEQPRYRHYGILVEHMALEAAAMPEGEERDALVLLLANHMKKLLVAVNPDGADDAKVFKDLRTLSNGAICLDPEQVQLHEFTVVQQPVGKKKKRKK